MKRPDLSKLKPKPRASKPKAGKPKDAKARSSVKVPAFAEDLYRDMRDRRLLLPAAALLIAIIAVPVALSATKEPAPVPAATAPPEEAEAVAPAVLTEDATGVRDYRERLDQLKSKNPFETSAAADAGATGEPADVIVSPTGDSTTTDTSTSTSAPTTSAPADVATTPPDSGSTSSGGDDGGGRSEPKILVAAPRIDVEAGRQGDARQIGDVKPGDLLPSKRNAPVAMFLEASGNLKFAQFAISENVSKATGDGRCRPRPNDCEFLRLAEGEKRTFVYGDDETRYTLKVTNIREELVKPRKASAG